MRSASQVLDSKKGIKGALDAPVKLLKNLKDLICVISSPQGARILLLHFNIFHIIIFIVYFTVKFSRCYMTKKQIWTAYFHWIGWFHFKMQLLWGGRKVFNFFFKIICVFPPEIMANCITLWPKCSKYLPARHNTHPFGKTSADP